MAAAIHTPGQLKQTQLDPSEFGEVVQQQGEKPNYAVRDPLEAPTGFTDYTVQEMKVVATWKESLASIFRLNGFTPIDNRPVELACNLQRTGGLDKQIFGVSRLQDGSLTKLGLPFDRTVPMAIFIAKNALSMIFPYARYDIDWSWRGEHASPGRSRAFIQADIDIVAPFLTALSDAQCISTVIKGLIRLGVPSFRVILNHVSIAQYFLQTEGVASKHYNDALRAIDKLKDDNLEEVVTELTMSVPGMQEDTARRILAKMSYKGPLSTFNFSDKPTQEAIDGLEHLKTIELMMIDLGIKPGMLEFAPNLTRGLSYYTGVVFETFMPGREAYGSIASGGRYDRLVEAFNKKQPLQGVGGSIGVTRLFDVMKAENLVDLRKQTTAQVYVGYRTSTEQQTAIQLATALREQLQLPVELETTVLKVKKQLAVANGKGIDYSILVMNNDEIVMKDMSVQKASAEQTPQMTFTSIAEVVQQFRQIKPIDQPVHAVPLLVSLD